jgi:F-type H+-transporting ATPase subunit delta
MQEKLTIARPYAAAAFGYAEEHAAFDAWSGMLTRLAMAVSDAELAPYIGHPKVSDAVMLALLEDLLGSDLDTPQRNFLAALLDGERLEIAPQIATLFERRRADAAGLVNVEVTTAYPLSDGERQKIDVAMRARTGRECQLDAFVDVSLIGGAVIKIGDSVTDFSLRGRLTALAQQLA